MEQGKFMGLLAELLELAAARDNRLSKEEVSQWFSEMALDQGQLEFIFRYLEENQIRVTDGDVKRGGRPETGKKKRVLEEENRSYQMYLSDLAGVSPCTREEIVLLALRAAKGDMAAADRLAEGNLHRVAEWARPFIGRGVVILDLIQEGNMALMEEIHRISSRRFPLDPEDFFQQLKEKSEAAMEEAIRCQESHKGIGEKVARRANRLMELTEEIARNQGRKATVAQLAELLHITEEEVRAIMKISLDVINLARTVRDPTAFETPEQE